MIAPKVSAAQQFDADDWPRDDDAAMTPYRKFLVTFYCSFGAYFVLLVVLYLNGYFAVDEAPTG